MGPCVPSAPVSLPSTPSLCCPRFSLSRAAHPPSPPSVRTPPPATATTPFLRNERLVLTGHSCGPPAIGVGCAQAGRTPGSSTTTPFLRNELPVLTVPSWRSPTIGAFRAPFGRSAVESALRNAPATPTFDALALADLPPTSRRPPNFALPPPALTEPCRRRRRTGRPRAATRRASHVGPCAAVQRPRSSFVRRPPSVIACRPLSPALCPTLYVPLLEGKIRPEAGQIPPNRGDAGARRRSSCSNCIVYCAPCARFTRCLEDRHREGSCPCSWGKAARLQEYDERLPTPPRT